MRKKLFPLLTLALAGIFVLQIWPSQLNVEASTAKKTNLEVTISPDKNTVDVNGPNNEVKFKVQVKNLAPCVNPLDIVAVFDHSLSMREDNDNENPPFEPISTAKRITKEFIDNLDKQNDRVALVSYNHAASLAAGLTQDFAKVKSAIDPLVASGATNIMEAFDKANAELNNARPGVGKVIVFFSDGSPNRPENAGASPDELARQAANRAKANGIRVISIALGKNPKNLDVESMRQFASSPQDYFYAYDTNEMAQVYAAINKDFKGISPDTVVKVFIGNQLDKMQFVRGSDNVRLENGYLIWNLGDLNCNDLRNLEFVMKPNPDLTYPTNVQYTAEVTNSAGGSDKSDPAKVDILAPNLSIDVTDNRTIARPGEEIVYEVTVRNDGSAAAYGVKVCNTIPPQVDQIDGSATNDGQTEGDNVTCWIVDLLPGQEIKLYVKGIVREEIPAGYTDVFDKAVLYYKKQVKDATDKTQVFRQEIPEPNYDLGVCLIADDGADRLTAVFGYKNNLDIPQNLDRSDSDNGQVVGRIPKILLSGNQSSAFMVVFCLEESVTWNTKAKNVEKTVTANIGTPNCETLSVSTPIETTPVDEFLGTPLVNTDPTSGENQPPRVEITDTSTLGSCQEGVRIFAKFNAQDSDGIIAGLQYSLNNGRSWLPITNVQGLGTASVSGEIQTATLKDLTYNLRIRALDNNSNVGLSSVREVNIDCEGIVIGSTQFNQLGQLSPLSSRGVVSAFANQELYMAIAISGGPRKVVVVSTAEISNKQQSFTLEYNDELELWETNLSFGEEGVYSLEVIASEGDEEIVKRSTNSVQVYKVGAVVDENGTEIESATTTLYYRPSVNADWQKWNAETFGQAALQSSNYGYYIEPGLYYLEASAPGYFTSRSVQFEAKQYGILAEKITLFANSNPFNWFRANQIYLAPTPVNDNLTKDLQSLLDKPLPEIQLESESGVLSTKNIVDAHLPTILVTWTDWGTISSAQLEQLRELSEQAAVQNGDVRLIAVGLLEGREENEALILRGEYEIEFYKPTDLSFFDKMFVISAPQYYFINSNGEIRDIQVGNRFADEILESLSAANSYVDDGSNK